MSKALCIALAAAALGGVAGPSLAAASSDVPVQTISTSGVDFQNRASVDAFYARLRQAAVDVCNSGSANPRISQGDAACTEQALSTAIQTIDRPTLTASYERHHGASEALRHAEAAGAGRQE